MRFTISTDTRGVPKAKVPSQYLWEVVEFLSAQRLTVHYTYGGEHFEISFPRMNLDTVQRTLEEWSNSHELAQCAV